MVQTLDKGSTRRVRVKRAEVPRFLRVIWDGEALWVPLTTTDDYYSHDGLVADANERDRVARDERYAFNGLVRSPYSDHRLDERGAIYTPVQRTSK